MSDESRPKGAASEIPAKKSGLIVPPSGRDLALFDVASSGNGTETHYVPTSEMASALDGDKWWAATARGAIMAMAETRTTFSIDDLRQDGLVPPPANPNAWGAAVSAAASAGLIVRVGFRKSRRRAAQSRHVSVWKRAE